MERSEPSLVPEWLKSSGSVTSVGTLRPRSSSSSLSDEHPRSRLVRNKSSSRNIDQDFGRTSSFDSISPSFARRSYSSNGSSHSSSYSNFGRNHHGRDCDRDIHEYQDKNRKVYGDHREKDISPRGMFSGFEKDGIRRSQSMFSGRRSEVWPKKPSAGSTVARANGVLEKDTYVGSMHNGAMEKNFFSLASEERQAAPEMGRVPSPGLSSAFRSSQSGASAISNGGKWISALAEAPAVVESSGTNILPGQQASVSSSLLQNKSNVTGLNMAEALSLAPLRAQTNSQLSTRSQRLEELTLKQCRQLVPVTPATPKHLAMSSLDKVKGGGNLGQPQHPTSSTLLSPPVRGGTVKADVSKTGNTGKLQVLKPARERNVVTSAVKDSSISADSIKVINPPVAAAAAAAAAGSSLSKRPTSSPVTLQRKHVLTTLEKRPTSQGQSRSEFFNHVRKKSGVTPSVVSDAQRTATGEIEVAPAPAAAAPTSQGRNENVLSYNNTQNGNEVKERQGDSISSGDGPCGAEKHDRNGKTSSFSPDLIISEEEEAAFLRSLGWVEDSDEDSDEGGLTEEEISSFYRDRMKVATPKHSRVGDAISSRLRSSDLKLES